MAQQIQNLKGFRDFLPEEKRIRDFVEKVMKSTFEKFGFQPIQTPTLEYAELLMGKYGDEADKLVYNFEDRGGRNIALRYDQTVPTTRILTQYRNDLPTYFRRYQIQSVFRAEKPQKGRYREFTQSDIDIFGSDSPTTDAEILACVYEVFSRIGIDSIIIKINDRKVLFDNLKPLETNEVDVFSIIQTVDKLDKKSEKEVLNELVDKGLEKEKAKKALDNIQSADMTQVLKQTFEEAKILGVPEGVLVFTPELARGLDYYNSVIYEVVDVDVPIGSIAGGGRYDNLINNLIGQDIPATGVSFGFARIVEIIKEKKLFDTKSNNLILATIIDKDYKKNILETVSKLREADISVEVFPKDDLNFGKQMGYADYYGYRFVLIIGEDEADKDVVTIKAMDSGIEKKVPVAQVVEYFEGLI